MIQDQKSEHITENNLDQYRLDFVILQEEILQDLLPPYSKIQPAEILPETALFPK